MRFLCVGFVFAFVSSPARKRMRKVRDRHELDSFPNLESALGIVKAEFIKSKISS